MKNLKLLLGIGLVSVIGVVQSVVFAADVCTNSPIIDSTCPSGSTFYGKMRLGSGYIFSDTFTAVDGTNEIDNVDYVFSEQCDYNNDTNPVFNFTKDIQNLKGKIQKGQTVKIVESTPVYYVDKIPQQRTFGNLLIKYIVTYTDSNNKSKTHVECKYYEVTWCGDGTIDSDRGEICDPSDSSHGHWGDGGCSNECKPVKKPECNSSYNGNRVLSLTSGAHLCSTGAMKDFTFNSVTHQWVWSCNNVQGQSVECSATGPYCGDGILDTGETCDPKDPNKTGFGNNGCDPVACMPINVDDPVCNSTYNGKRLTDLTEGNHLCTAGTYSNFTYDSSSYKRTWKCSNAIGAGVDCSAEKPYCGDKIIDAGEECDGSSDCSDQCKKMYCGDGIRNNGEQCDPEDKINKAGWGPDGCDKFCEPIFNSPVSCTETYYNTLRYGSGYTFSDSFTAGTNRWMYNFDVNFDEKVDLNLGANPAFNWTNQLTSNNMLVKVGTTMKIIESSPEYIIKAKPAKREYGNLYIEYTVWHTDNAYTGELPNSKLNKHKECIYYDVSRCGDGVVDEGYETCDPEAPEWKNGNNGKTCNPVTCEPETVPTKGDLDIDKTLVGSGLVNKTGDIVTWNIKVTARGGDVTDFIVTDKLPEVLEYSSYSVVHNPGGLTVSDPVLSGNQVIWSVNGTLKDGDYLTIQLNTKAKWMPKVDYKNVACVRPADDPNGDDCDEEEVKLGGLKVEKTLIGPKEIKEVGDIVQWTLKVTAEGGAVKNPVIQDKMPDVLGFTGYSVVRNGGLSISEPTISGNLVTWKTSGVLADGDYIEIRVDTYAKVMPEKEEKNVLCAWPEDKPEDEKCDNEPVHSPNLWIKKAFRDGSKEKTVKVGDIIAYKIDFGNKGNAAATITSIKDFLPKNVEYVSSEIYIISGSNSHLLSGSEVVGGGTTVEGVYVDVYGGMTLNPNTTGYIILTGKILGDYTGSTQNWACIYLNDKKIDCDWAKHNFTGDNPGGDIMCKAPILSKTSDEICVGSPVEGSTSVTCNSDGGVAKNIEILCDGVVTHSGQNVSSLNGVCAFSGAGAHTVKCSVDGVTKDASGNECKGTYTLSTKSCGGGNGGTSCKLEDVKDTSNKYIKDVECRTDNGTKRTIVIDCGANAKQRYLTGENMSVYTGQCEYTETGTKTIQCRIYTSNGSQLGGTCQKTTTISGGGSSGGGGGGGGHCTLTDGSRSSKPVCNFANPECFNVNEGNVSIEKGEILPFYFNIYRDKVKESDYNYIVYKGSDFPLGNINSYEKILNDTSKCNPGDIALNSLKCEYKILDGNNTVVYNRVVPCLDDGTNLNKKGLIGAWMNWQKLEYNNLQSTSNNNYTFTTNIYTTNPIEWKLPNGSNNLNLGEYQFQISKVTYLQCDESGKWRSDVVDTVCQSNFVLTDSYSVQKTPSGNFTKTSTDKLRDYLYSDGKNTFEMDKLLSSIAQAESYAPNEAVNTAMDKFIAKYEKLAVNVKLSNNSFLKGANVRKVPGKNIYFISGDVSVKGSDTSITTPFTIVQTRGNIVINGSSEHNMMLLTKGDITFSGDCTSDQVVKGIFYAGGYLRRSGVNKNDDLSHNYRCSNGGLHVKGVLIGKGLGQLMADSRSHLNNWFNTTDKQRVVMDGASVLIEYSPSIFTKSTMPPGAEDFTTALTVYKN